MPSFINPRPVPMQRSGDRSAVNHLAGLEEYRSAMRVMQRLLNALCGGGDGTFAIGADPDDSGKVKANTVPNLSLKIRPFWGFIDQVPFQVPDELVSSLLTAPSSSPRIDSVIARALPGLTGEFAILTGIEAGSPTAPTPGDGEILLAWIHHRVGETSIKEGDDSTNGYIEDKRTFTNV